MELFHKYRIAVFLGVTFLIAGCATQAPYYRLSPSLQREMTVFGGTQYIPLAKVCDSYDIKWEWDSFINKAILEKGGKKFVLMAGSDTALVNGLVRKMDRPIILDGGAVFVPVSFIRNNLGYIIEGVPVERAPQPEISKRFAIRTIVLDAGHGGKDIGASGRRLRLKEKDLVSSITKRLKSILEENGIRVIMTRDADIFVPLSRRAEIANRSGADLFVSIHVNASRTRSLKGFECYYLSDATDDNARAVEAAENASLKLDEGTISGHSKSLDATLWDMTLTENRIESSQLARYICNAMEEGFTIRNRGVRSARFYVLKETRMPAVLVEMGYISNRYEEMNLKDPKFLDRMTDSVAQGILRYKQEYERTQGFSNS